MVDDPTDSLTRVFKDNQELDIKLAALEAELASKADSAKKIDFSRQALLWGIERSEDDLARIRAVQRIRLTALNALISLGDKDPGTVPLLVRVHGMDKKNDATLEETARALVALGANGSDEAAKYLASLLTNYNSLQRSKATTTRDKLLIKQILTSMQTARNGLVKNALLQAQYIDYDNGILRQMEEVLQSLP